MKGRPVKDPEESARPGSAASTPGGSAPDGSSTSESSLPSDLTRRELRALRRRRPILKGIVIALVVVLAVVVGGGLYAAYRLNGNLSSLDITDNLLKPAPGATTDPTTGHTAMNLLVMGVDTREGANSAYGDPTEDPGLRSDTTMLVHLAADRRSAVVVSIPRDAMIPAPPRKGESSASASSAATPRGATSATTPATAATSTQTGAGPGCVIDAPVSRWTKRMFNSNIEDGGVTCVVATVMQNTGISIDHVMTVDFTGFKNIVNALGTVEICTTSPVKDKYSGLDLAAGRHRLNGEQALAFVRTRHGVGDGSDTGRVKLQQDFLAAVVRQATSTGVLLNPPRLYNVLDAATRSLKTDAELANVSALSGLAAQLREIRPANIRFITAPIEPYPQDKERVQLSAAAGPLWEILRKDEPWPGTTGASGSASAAASSTPTVAPSSVSVAIENASGTAGLGGQVAQALRVQGFTVGAVTAAAAPSNGVVVHHTASQLAQAQEVALAFPGATLKADGAAGSPVRVSVGRGAPRVVAVPNRAGQAPLPSQPITAAPVPGSTTSSTPTLEAKVASDDVCSDTSKS